MKRSKKYLDWHVNSHVFRLEAAYFGHGRSLEYMGGKKVVGLVFRRTK